VTPLIFDLDLNCFVDAWGSRTALESLQLVRSGAIVFPVQFCRGPVKAVLSASAVAGVVVKEAGKFDADSLIPQCLFSYSSTTGLYTATMNLRSDALNDAFNVDGNEANDIASIERVLYLGWSIDDVVVGSGAALPLTILNNGYRGTEGFAFPTANGVFSPFLCSAYEGGDADNLNAIATRLMPIGRVIALVIDGVLQFWQLTTGTAATDTAGGILRPLDFNADTNAKLWIQVL
jgi:hypothetical protein